MIKIILLKDLRIFFRNPLTYVMLGLFSLIMGWVFFSQLSQFMGGIQAMPIQSRNQYDFANAVILRIFGHINFLFLFFTPLLSMGAISDEVRARSILYYFSSNVSNWELVLAKIIGLFAKGLSFVATVFIYPILLGNIQLTDNSFIISAVFGLLFNMVGFLSLGLLASCLTKSQIFSGILSFFFVFGSWMVSMFADLSQNDLVSRILQFLAINTHFENMVKGNIGLSDIFFYLSFIYLVLLLVHKKLELK